MKLLCTDFQSFYQYIVYSHGRIGVLLISRIVKGSDFDMRLSEYCFYDEFTTFENLIRENGGVERTYPKGYILTAATQPKRMSYYILDGTAQYSATNESGKCITYFFMRHGSIFPLNCTNDYFQLEQSLSFRAYTPLSVLEFPALNLISMMNQDSRLPVAVVNHYCSYCNLLLNRLLTNASLDSSRKICTFLYLRYIEQRSPHHEVCLTQEDIAALTDVSVPQVARVIHALKKRGIISTARKEITILDPSSLRNLCE